MHPITECDVCHKQVRIKNTYKHPTGQRVCGRCMRSNTRKTNSQKDMIRIIKRRSNRALTKDEEKELWRLYNEKKISYGEMCKRMKILKAEILKTRRVARIKDYYEKKKDKDFKQEFQKLKEKKSK